MNDDVFFTLARLLSLAEEGEDRERGRQARTYADEIARSLRRSEREGSCPFCSHRISPSDLLDRRTPESAEPNRELLTALANGWSAEAMRSDGPMAAAYQGCADSLLALLAVSESAEPEWLEWRGWVPKGSADAMREHGEGTVGVVAHRPGTEATEHLWEPVLIRLRVAAPTQDGEPEEEKPGVPAHRLRMADEELRRASKARRRTTRNRRARMSSNRTLMASCVCGGWVMVALLDSDPKKNAWHYQEAARMAAEGFAIGETTVGAIRSGEVPSCKHRGDCTTDPGGGVSAPSGVLGSS